MKILNWNIERLKRPAFKEAVLAIIDSYDADIIVLTETSAQINPGNSYNSVQTFALSSFHDGIKYKEGENRVTLFSKYPIIQTHKTYDDYTSVCADVATTLGPLRIYATITGVFGGIGERFKQDILGQMSDFKTLLYDCPTCIIGDLNTTFSGYTYPSHAARNTLIDYFDKKKMTNITAPIADNVDHIILSIDYLGSAKILTSVFNEGKKLSDHIGICVEIDF
ncbi:endonuclease/exonuclease/phosphatase family protein [Flavobacterium subsaxonicum]|uniref:Endonuclease/exonuclease/phosphatase domain-containing protein n=1 Tax=Flavobacterium subsaxonicum WB 4.1-42 = DSM 21790 TaxID=1121898 RepID=A0A0A2MN49_9FLAO|nr:endonuclease/exonuclease/phosphatase family protein [Flavobacterium subsaxonicum]KGO92908.1 hypothetical protein Q766_09745 [Flavobacterium subsaxonicum WB 4.1-42 = DSM 21790]